MKPQLQIIGAEVSVHVNVHISACSYDHRAHTQQRIRNGLCSCGNKSDAEYVADVFGCCLAHMGLEVPCAAFSSGEYGA